MRATASFSAYRTATATSVLTLCAAAALLGTLAACASGGDAQPSPTATATPAATATPDPTISVTWIPQFAPAGGADTAQQSAYFRLAQRECQVAYEVATDDDGAGHEEWSPSVRDLYVASAAACLAAFDGESDLWSEATLHLESVDPADLGCWDRELYDSAAQIVDAHATHPNAVFQLEGDASSSCPQLTSLHPAEGPSSGGYPVTVHGENLPESFTLWFGSTSTEAQRNPDGSATVQVPESEYAGYGDSLGESVMVLVQLDGAPARGATPILEFTYTAE